MQCSSCTHRFIICISSSLQSLHKFKNLPKLLQKQLPYFRFPEGSNKISYYSVASSAIHMIKCLYFRNSIIACSLSFFFQLFCDKTCLVSSDAHLYPSLFFNKVINSDICSFLLDYLVQVWCHFVYCRITF